MNHVRQIDENTHLWESCGIYVTTQHESDRNNRITVKSAFYNGRNLYWIFDRSWIPNTLERHEIAASSVFKDPAYFRKCLKHLKDHGRLFPHDAYGS